MEQPSGALSGINTIPLSSQAGDILSDRRRGYVIVLLLAITLVSFLDRQAIAILVEPIKRDLKLSDTEVGALTGLFFSFFYAAAGIPMARLADTRDKRTIISLCIAGWSCATALGAATMNFIQMAITRTFAGIGEAGCGPAIQSTVADLFAPEQRTKIFGMMGAASAIGMGLSLFLGGLLIEHMSWRAVMVILAAPGPVLAILAFTTLPKSGRQKGDPPLEPLGSALRGLLRIPTFRSVAFITFFASSSSFALIAWMAVFMIRTHGMSPGDVGAAMGPTLALGLLIGNISCGVIADHLAKRDSRWLLFLLGGAMVLNLPLGLLCFFLEEAFASMLIFGLLMISTGFWAPISQTINMGVVKPDVRAVTASTAGILIAVGGAVGPLVVGVLNDHLNPVYGQETMRYSLSIMLVGYAAAAVTALLAIKGFERDYLPRET